MTSPQLTAKDEMVETFLDAAARGDLSQVRALLSHAPSLVDQTGHSGWTALMLAARNGHLAVAAALLEHGCDASSVNGSAQTAHDVAKFWGHGHICDLLSRTDGGRPGGQRENFFGRETLDRMSGRRTDRLWLEAKQRAGDSVYLLFSDLSPMVRSCHQGRSQLCRLRHEAVKDLVLDPASVLVFLGVEKQKTSPSSPSSPSSSASPSPSSPPAWFAISAGGDPSELLKLCGERNCFFPQAAGRDLLTLGEDEAGVVAQARSLLAWHSRYGFCPTCGGGAEPQEGGHKRSCLNSDCRSRRGVHNTCYPRVDPVVIMLVVHPDGDQCLLGRKKIFPGGLFSCLAGFIEPGETVEAAVRREVQEESGVQVGPVTYVSSQPWPMPSSLMIGCLAVAVTTDIKVDEDEIEEARWFPRQQVVDSLFRGVRTILTVPPRQTIAHQLIRHWIGANANL